jgi:hypothetical protein
MQVFESAPLCETVSEIRKLVGARYQWLTPVIVATQEAEIMTIAV